MGLRPRYDGHLLDEAGNAVADTVQCVHCNMHFQRVNTSAWCMNCNGVVCPKPGCSHRCRPFEKWLDQMEKHGFVSDD